MKTVTRNGRPKTNGRAKSRTIIPRAIAAIAPDGNLTPRQRRRFMIEMVKRRVRPGSGSSLDFLRERTAMHNWPDLREILKDFRWVVVGGVATRAYMPERATGDMDILVRARDGKEVIEHFKRAGYQVLSRLGVPGYLLRAPNGVKLDVIFGNYPWIDKSLAQPRLDPAGYPTIPLPYLVLMRLDAQRAQDWADVSRMIAQASEDDRRKTRRILAKYRPEDLDDLESLIFFGEKELELPGGEKRRPKRKSKK
jgi:hypothetical protein